MILAPHKNDLRCSKWCFAPQGASLRSKKPSIANRNFISQRLENVQYLYTCDSARLFVRDFHSTQIDCKRLFIIHSLFPCTTQPANTNHSLCFLLLLPLSAAPYRSYRSLPLSPRPATPAAPASRSAPAALCCSLLV